MMVGKTSKKKGKGKKKSLAPKGGVTKPKYKKVKADQSDAECFFCKEKGHWRRNCKKYLDSLKNKKQGTADNYMVEERRNQSSSREWSKCYHLIFRISFFNNAH